jgi:hypothetical protein
MTDEPSAENRRKSRTRTRIVVGLVAFVAFGGIAAVTLLSSQEQLIEPSPTPTSSNPPSSTDPPVEGSDDAKLFARTPSGRLLSDAAADLDEMYAELYDVDGDGIIDPDKLAVSLDSARKNVNAVLDDASQKRLRVLAPVSVAAPDPEPQVPLIVTVSVAIIGAVSGLIAAITGGIQAVAAWRKSREAPLTTTA